jgi:hypothetical protein
MNKINWIEVFEKIELDKPLPPKAYITTTDEQKENYYSEASFSLTYQYLSRFKKETWLFDSKRKIEYIDEISIEKPPIGNSESPVLNQVAFNAMNNFREFIEVYKQILIKRAEDEAYQEPFNEVYAKVFGYSYDPFDKSRHNYGFNNWLQVFEGWDGNDPEQYRQLATEKLLREYKRFDENGFPFSFPNGHDQTDEYKNGFWLEGGYFSNDGIKAFVDNPDLIYLFRSSKRELLVMGKPFLIKTGIFLEAYCKRYKEGIEFFNSKYKLSADTIYSGGNGLGKHVENLQGKYSEWKRSATCKYLTFKVENIGDAGFYNGIIEALVEYAKLYPNELKGIFPEQPNSIEVEPDYNKILSDLSNSENKFWKSLPMNVVIDHFRVMTEKESKNGKPYLTKKGLVSFIKRGFLNDDTQPIQKINCGNREKGFVLKRFHELFALAAAEYSHPNDKEKFIALFKRCFDNWDKVDDLFKPNKTKEKWE